MSTDEQNNTNDGQSRVGEAGANLTAVLEAARMVVEWHAIVKRDRSRYLDGVHEGRIIQYSFDGSMEHQAWLALHGLEKSLDELKEALEAANKQ